MGREVKRVAADFEWPLNKVWRGFVNPHYARSHQCGSCEGSGYSKRAKELSDLWYGRSGWREAPFDPASKGSAPYGPDHPGIAARAARNASDHQGEAFARARDQEADRLCEHFNGQWCHHLSQDEVDALVEGHRLWDFTRDFVPGTGWVDKPEGTAKPTAAEVNSWSLSGGGHDAINRSIVVEHACRREGSELLCPLCSGEGRSWESAQAKLDYDAWEPTEPPSGTHWQVWETVSEGSPITPAMADPEELARWLAANRAGSIDEGTSAESWLRFILGPGWAPSMVMSGGAMRSGVDALSQEDD